MKYLFELNHPKHYYQFKYVMQNLKNKGHQVDVVARNKDVLLNILEQDGISYTVFGVHKKSLYAKYFAFIYIIYTYYKLFKKIQSDVIISKASMYGCFIAKLFRKKSIIFPDSEVVVVTNKLVVPIATRVVTPDSFELSYGNKHIKVPGFFENCYLLPSVFKPNETIIEEYDLKKPYAIFRFIGWTANHDYKNSGFTLEQKKKMIDIVSENMTVYISSEKKLPQDLIQYKLNTPASKIHDVLYYADMYIGDSQTMATEASLLGTPAIRSNSFVGEHDMSNFKILEKKYNLLYNIFDFEDVIIKLQELSSKSHKKEWQEKREKYNLINGDTNMIITEIIENL